MTADEPVFVLGFPKSGTTWIKRMVCDALPGWLVPVMPDERERTERFNAAMGLKHGVGPEVRWAHLMPEELTGLVGRDITRGIYIYRDFRDVLVSSFFYTHTDEHEQLLGRETRLRLPGALATPWSSLKRQYWRTRTRRAFRAYATRMCTEGWKRFGTWIDHVQGWRSFARDPDRRIAVISYEELLDDTVGTMARALDFIGAGAEARSRLPAVVMRHSAKELGKLPRQAIPGGPRYGRGRSTLRKAVVGDYRNFLTRREARLVERTQGWLLRELGYVDSAEWVKQLRPR